MDYNLSEIDFSNVVPTIKPYEPTDSHKVDIISIPYISFPIRLETIFTIIYIITFSIKTVRTVKMIYDLIN